MQAHTAARARIQTLPQNACITNSHRRHPHDKPCSALPPSTGQVLGAEHKMLQEGRKGCPCQQPCPLPALEGHSPACCQEEEVPAPGGFPRLGLASLEAGAWEVGFSSPQACTFTVKGVATRTGGLP